MTQYLHNPSTIQNANNTINLLTLNDLVSQNLVAKGCVNTSVFDSLSQLTDSVLVSCSPTQVQQLLNGLLQQLKAENLSPDQFESLETSIIINGQAFNEDKKASDFILQIMKAYSFGEVLQPKHSEIILQVLQHHPRAQEKLQDFQGLTVGEIQVQGRKSRCFFVIKTSGDKVDISYKQSLDAYFEQERAKKQLALKEKLPLAADRVIQCVLRAVKMFPMLLDQTLNALIKNLPHRRYDTETIIIYMRNLFKISEDLPQLFIRAIKAGINLLIMLELDGMHEKLNQVLEFFRPHFRQVLNSENFDNLLEIFETCVLPTGQLYQVTSLFSDIFYLQNDELIEKFMSVPMRSMFACKRVDLAMAYITSALLTFDIHVHDQCLNMLIDFADQTFKRPGTRQYSLQSISYLLYYYVYKPQRFKAKFGKLMRKLIKSPQKPLRHVTLDSDTDYSAVLPPIDRPNYGTLYLPFNAATVIREDLLAKYKSKYECDKNMLETASVSSRNSTS